MLCANCDAVHDIVLHLLIECLDYCEELQHSDWFLIYFITFVCVFDSPVSLYKAYFSNMLRALSTTFLIKFAIQKGFSLVFEVSRNYYNKAFH